MAETVENATPRFSTSKVETPERTFWVIGANETRILPPWGWGTAESEAEAEVALTRLEVAYTLGLTTGRDEAAAWTQERLTWLRARIEALAEEWEEGVFPLTHAHAERLRKVLDEVPR